MNILSLDTETTLWNKGNLHDQRNKIVCWSGATDKESDACLWTEQSHRLVTLEVQKYDLIVGFNWKFDIGWFKKMGVDFTGVKCWDVQIAEFILSYQRNKYPSLNETCERYGIPIKHDVVKTEYWDKGINTDEIPWPILREYAAHDAAITLQCYHAQIGLMSTAQVRLCQLMCQDLVVLQEMEDNGIVLDVELCASRSKQLEEEIESIEKQLTEFYPHIPLNFGSNDDLSAFLYGGTVVEETRVADGFYKTGLKAGLPKLKKVDVVHTLPRLFEPLKGSEMKKEGNFKVDEGTLRKLKGKHKGAVELLLRLSKLQKLNGTYYQGLPKLIEEMNWEQGILHGQLNQTLAQTGRLSSSRPNQQNFASELQDIFVSIYE